MTAFKMNIIKPIVLSTVLAISLAGCMVGPKLEKPEPITEEQFRFDSIEGDTMINLAWWDLYDDPMLDTLIYLSLEHNQDIQA